jgi:hypothetical protein
MSKFDYCGDLYDLNSTNTKLCGEHQKWYDEYRAASIGDLLDRMQDMVDSYRKVVDRSTEEINTLKDELKEVNQLSDERLVTINNYLQEI